MAITIIPGGASAERWPQARAALERGAVVVVVLALDHPAPAGGVGRSCSMREERARAARFATAAAARALRRRPRPGARTARRLRRPPARRARLRARAARQARARRGRRPGVLAQPRRRPGAVRAGARPARRRRPRAARPRPRRRRPARPGRDLLRAGGARGLASPAAGRPASRVPRLLDAQGGLREGHGHRPARALADFAVSVPPEAPRLLRAPRRSGRSGRSRRCRHCPATRPRWWWRGAAWSWSHAARTAPATRRRASEDASPPLRACSSSSRRVIRYPLMTKKTWTPQ